MADGRESQYMTPRGNIIQSPRTAGNLSAALGSLEAMWFCLALGIGVGGLLQSARHYRNKIQTGKQGSRLGCCWHLTNQEKETAELHREFSPLHVNDVLYIYFLGLRVVGVRTSVLLSKHFKEMIQNPLPLAWNNQCHYCLFAALSFLGKDPGLAGRGSQCGG